MNSQKFARKFISHYIIYIYIILFTFSLGYFVVLSFYTYPNEKIEEYADRKSENYTKFEFTEIDGEWKFKPVKEFQTKKNINILENHYPQDIEFKKPFCKDKRILPVWKLLQKDEYFKFQSGGKFREPNCAKMFEFLKVDLNNDGQEEFILRGKNLDLCGAAGNCGFWVFGKRRGNRYQKLLSSQDHIDITEIGIQISKNKINGYKTILLKTNLSANSISYESYKFNGWKYIENKCSVKTPVYENNSINFKWKFISCKKYFKDL